MALSAPKNTKAPLVVSNTPNAPFARPPAASKLPRQRMMASRDSQPRARRGNAAPNPNASITTATSPRSRPSAAKSDAAPSVGPTRNSTRAEQDAGEELAQDAVLWRCAKNPVGPIADRPASNGNSGLKRRQQQHQADGDDQRSGDIAKPLRVKSDRMTDGRQEQPQRDESQRKARGERRGPPAMLRSRRAQDDWQDRQDARREDRQYARDEGEQQAADGHSRQPIRATCRPRRRSTCGRWRQPIARLPGRP